MPATGADHADGTGSAHVKLAPIRFRFILLAAFGIGCGISWSDLTVKMLYGSRYHGAGWMLTLLLVGSRISVLAALNESAVLGSGKPKYVSAGGMALILILAAGIPLGFYTLSLPGAIVALAAGEASRYLILLIAQMRFRVSFFCKTQQPPPS